MGGHLQDFRIGTNLFLVLHIVLLSVQRTNITVKVAKLKTSRFICLFFFVVQVIDFNILQVHCEQTSSSKIQFNTNNNKTVHVFYASNSPADLVPLISASTSFRHNADTQPLYNLWDNFPSPLIHTDYGHDKHTGLTCLQLWYLSGSGSNPHSTPLGRPKPWMPAE